jgi:hypothetical protein
MHPSGHDLRSILHPVSLDGFYSEYWDKKPLLVQRSDAAYFASLLSISDIENLISFSDARFPAIRLAKGGSYYPPETYTKSVKIGDLSFDGVPDLNRISVEYGKGATIAMPALHRTWRPLGELCERIERLLDHSIHTNLYLTPGRSTGFTPHYDTHDVLVLQLAGKKTWHIDEPSIRLPHDSQTFSPSGFQPGSRLMDLELTAGDLLYLPRGYTHSTTTSASYSAHITLGVNVYTWADVAYALDPLCVEREECRKALPPGFASQPGSASAMAAHISALFPNQSGSRDYALLIDQFLQKIKTQRPRGALRFRADVMVLSLHSLLAAPNQSEYSLRLTQDQICLDVGGRSYVFPPQLGYGIKTMCAESQFRVEEIAEDASADAMLGFARYLHGIGFLRAIS